MGELVSCAAAAPTFPRPRGRGPPDCTWDVQLGSWLRADGSAWVKVRNEKRDRAREAQRVEKQAKQALISTSKAERGLLEQSRKDQSRKDRESLKHVKEERLQLKGEVREAREAEAEARDARVQEVLFDGETVYCAKHLYQLNAGDAHVKCGTCADLGWHDVRHAPPHPVNFSPTPTPSLSEPTFPHAGASSTRMGAFSASTTTKALALQSSYADARTRPTRSRARCSIVKIRGVFEKTFGFLNMAWYLS